MPDPKPYRCVARSQIHIGGTEFPEYVQPKEILLWDGITVFRQDGEKLKVSNFRAMINAGWMVPAESDIQIMAPPQSQVQIHEAAPRGPERKKVNVPVVQDEERDLGSIGSVRRGANEGETMSTHQAQNAGEKQVPQPTAEVVRRKKYAVQREGGDDGVVVGRLKSGTNFEKVEVGKDDGQVLRNIENSKGVAVEKLVGRDLNSAAGQEILRGNEPASQFQNEGVQVSSGGSSIGGADEGVVIGKIGSQQPQVKMETLDDLRSWADTAKGDLPRLVKTLFRKFDAAYAQAAVVKEHDLVPKAEGAASNTFEWDTSTHWKSREKLVREEYAEDLNALLEIREVETSKGVLKAVDELLAALEG